MSRTLLMSIRLSPNDPRRPLDEGTLAGTTMTTPAHAATVWQSRSPSLNRVWCRTAHSEISRRDVPAPCWSCRSSERSLVVRRVLRLVEHGSTAQADRPPPTCKHWHMAPHCPGTGCDWTGAGTHPTGGRVAHKQTLNHDHVDRDDP